MNRSGAIVPLDRYTAPNEKFVLVVKSRIAVLGAERAEETLADQPRLSP